MIQDSLYSWWSFDMLFMMCENGKMRTMVTTANSVGKSYMLMLTKKNSESLTIKDLSLERLDFSRVF